MKKTLAILLVVTLSIGTIACSNSASTETIKTAKTSTETTVKTGSETKESSANIANELSKKIEALCQKDIFNTILEGKSVSEALRESFSNISKGELDLAIKNYPQLSFDVSNFANDESTYNWLANALKTVLKDAIDKKQITQEQINDVKGYLTLMGIKLPNITIEPGLSDKDINDLCLTAVQIADKFSDPTMLKLIGIDLEKPDALENLKNSLTEIIIK